MDCVTSNIPKVFIRQRPTHKMEVFVLVFGVVFHSSSTGALLLVLAWRTLRPAIGNMYVIIKLRENMFQGTVNFLRQFAHFNDDVLISSRSNNTSVHKITVYDI